MAIIIETFENFGILPIIEIDDSKDAIPLAQALIAGGLPIAEITQLGITAINLVKKTRSKE
jgi:2-dehydro-3-deoxyphosphogluconate aldolase/(4S)-4-hydroxy-2-oxoglutarate aldolase